MLPVWQRLVKRIDFSNHSSIAPKLAPSPPQRIAAMDAGLGALQRGRRQAAEMNVVVMGLIRAAGWDGINAMLERLRRTVSGFRDHRILLLENDSNDDSDYGNYRKRDDEYSRFGEISKRTSELGERHPSRKSRIRIGEGNLILHRGGTRGAMQRQCLADPRLHCQLATYRVPKWDSNMKVDRLIAMAHHRSVGQCFGYSCLCS